MKIALFEPSDGLQSKALVNHLLTLLAQYGDEVVADVDASVNMVISLGGDGTFLRAAAQVGAFGIPIVGINAGHLGFLADVSPSEMDAFVEQMHRGRYEIRERSVLALAIDGGEVCDYALNEVAVTKHDSGSMISIRADVNGETVTTYRSDGLLVATPTGSTAYSLSAGGPIIYPQSDVFLLTAVAPHSLNMRPIVVSDNKEITLTVTSRNGHFLVTTDGRLRNCPSGTTLTLRKAPYTIKVVKQEGHTFFRTLQNKMMWGVAASTLE